MLTEEQVTNYGTLEQIYFHGNYSIILFPW